MVVLMLLDLRSFSMDKAFKWKSSQTGHVSVTYRKALLICIQETLFLLIFLWNIVFSTKDQDYQFSCDEVSSVIDYRVVFTGTLYLYVHVSTEFQKTKMNYSASLQILYYNVRTCIDLFSHVTRVSYYGKNAVQQWIRYFLIYGIYFIFIPRFTKS